MFIRSVLFSAPRLWEFPRLPTREVRIPQERKDWDPGLEHCFVNLLDTSSTSRHTGFFFLYTVWAIREGNMVGHIFSCHTKNEWSTEWKNRSYHEPETVTPTHPKWKGHPSKSDDCRPWLVERLSVCSQWHWRELPCCTHWQCWTILRESTHKKVSYRLSMCLLISASLTATCNFFTFASLEENSICKADAAQFGQKSRQNGGLK